MPTRMRGFALVSLSWLALGCAARNTGKEQDSGHHADVVAVQATGEPGDYLFSVAVSSPDSGCNRYADWWEVTSPRGELIFRRILGHSHADEQPFTRSGGPVAIDADRVVLVRAHMNPDGYGGVVMRGTPASGFRADDSVRWDFARSLETTQPLPEGCAF